jgi:hypothetical protein
MVLATKMMKLTMGVLLLCTVSAFAPNTLQQSVRARTTTSPSSLLRVPPPVPPRGLPIVQSAKILPVAYTSASAALLFRATQAVTKADAAVLVATALLAFFNLAPTDNVRLASAKRADTKYPPATSGVAKQKRQAAKTWRSVVRIKLIGQVVGLVWMAAAQTSSGWLRGAAMVMGANTVFFLCGAGAAMHDADGTSAPMPPSTAKAILTMNTILTAAAFFAASAPVESTRRTVLASVYAGGAFIGGLEGIATMLFRKK